ncbi:methylase of chemotaxis methyl-accepting protein [Thioflavicoccus mobilis 8321]|uniref:protein-glutamate O-methyltransferase n=1 Tax=Thioflavicoccus mobilis 8321 TaxID=765912 RepID=L0GWT0_9GAMM|nr:chemotaxis protein CheB [Thioflavicoccus mobilis]AGA91218.1 methylase of chemotaxis methyl-accepting protein [Thioflavicoccus mobilis 8321]
MPDDTQQDGDQNGAEPAATDLPADEGMAVEPIAPPKEGFPVVGIGASAGGLAAFETFFSGIAGETGMAYVLVQHLAPDHKSILSELVRRHARIPVHEVEDGMIVEADCAYIIPPSLDMALLDGRLHLLQPSAPRGLRLPIDFFFRSLAQDQHERAICVVLSGSGSDGTLGARAVKGEGGLVLAQTPGTAAYDSMPRSVIATGLADFVLAPGEMAQQIMRYVAHAFRKVPPAPAGPPAKIEDSLAKIGILLRDATGHDFSQYKQSTLVRRIERRMALHQITRQDDYISYLRQDSAEIAGLFQDLLIGVTSFFRDPEAFAALEQEVIPRLFAGKSADTPVRVWVPCCSSGEEAYSIAILLQEHQETLRQSFRVQVFATDIDAGAIAQGRAGVYPASVAADVSTERLTRYFCLDPEAGVCRIQKVIRDLLVFSEQDLIRDPPFSKLDLISCRNLLIYLNGDLQRRLIPLFHYALKPDGLLFLGSSESVGDALRLFSPLSRKWKIYLRLEPPTGRVSPLLGDLISAPPLGGAPSSLPRAPADTAAARIDLRAVTEQALLRHCSTAAILANSRGEILYFHGRTGQFLEPAPGEAAMNLFTMARKGLRRDLTSALQRAVARQESVHAPDLRVKTNGDVIRVDLTVRPVRSEGGAAGEADLYLVALDDTTPAAPAEANAPVAGAPTQPGSAARVAELEQELRAKEEYLQATLEEMETANEELKSINEEMQSVNEELQSANEELETSKEELQSVNEELATVNAELQIKVTDLSRANNDMNNLLAGTGVATLFVDHGLRITRFTPATTQLIKLIPSDVGRPVGDIVSNLVAYTELEADVHEVLTSLVPQEREVESRAGAWYRMHIGPYRTLDNVIEGAVITFADISQHKAIEAELQEARAFAEGVVDTVREPLLVLDPQLHVLSANRAYYHHFQVDPAEVQGRPFWALGDGQWDIPALRQHLVALQSGGDPLEAGPVTQVFPRIGRRTLLLNARILDATPGRTGAMLIAIADLTEQDLDGVTKAAAISSAAGTQGDGDGHDA